MNTDELANAISSRVDPELKTKIVGVREWIEGDRMKAYIRVQRRFLLDQYKFVLVLAALDVYEEEDRGRGLCSPLCLIAWNQRYGIAWMALWWSPSITNSWRRF